MDVSWIYHWVLNGEMGTCVEYHGNNNLNIMESWNILNVGFRNRNGHRIALQWDFSLTGKIGHDMGRNGWHGLKLTNIGRLRASMSKGKILQASCHICPKWYTKVWPLTIDDAHFTSKEQTISAKPRGFLRPNKFWCYLYANLYWKFSIDPNHFRQRSSLSFSVHLWVHNGPMVFAAISIPMGQRGYFKEVIPLLVTDFIIPWFVCIYCWVLSPFEPEILWSNPFIPKVDSPNLEIHLAFRILIPIFLVGPHCLTVKSNGFPGFFPLASSFDLDHPHKFRVENHGQSWITAQKMVYITCPFTTRN